MGGRRQRMGAMYRPFGPLRNGWGCAAYPALTDRAISFRRCAAVPLQRLPRDGAGD